MNELWSPGKGEVKRAVDGLSFSAMTNEITVLLGHNGAGKSTTMSMLTGMVSPDSGSLFVGDLDVTKGRGYINVMTSSLRHRYVFIGHNDPGERYR